MRVGTRRDFLWRTLGFGATLALASCSGAAAPVGSGGGSTTTPPAAPLVAANPVNSSIATAPAPTATRVAQALQPTRWNVSIDEYHPLRLAHVTPPGHPYHEGAVRFAELIAERSGNQILIDIYHSGMLGQEAELLDQVRAGEIDLAITSAPPLTTLTPELGVFDLPFLFRSRAHAAAVMDGQLGQGLLEPLNRLDLVGLAFWETGFRHITNSLRPIESPRDLEGLRLRIEHNTIHAATFKVLGARPSSMNWSETVDALRRGELDGQENALSVVGSQPLWDNQRYLSLTGHFYGVAPLVMSLASMSTLPVAAQTLLRETARELAPFQRDLVKAQDERDLTTLREKGVKVSAVHELSFVVNTQNVYSEFGRLFDATRVRSIRDLPA